MFHVFNGLLEHFGKKTILTNDLFGIEVVYIGYQKQGKYFLYPYMDDNKKTIIYFAFDSMDQKIVFEDLLKVNGVGPKTAFQISQMPKENLATAIKNLDIKFFQSIPGIGPKSAKKIVLELKGSFDFEDVQKMDIDQKLFKDIVKSLKGFGYDADRIKTTLQKYDGKISKENMTEVIKWIISQI